MKNEELKIEKGIPLPPKRNGQHGRVAVALRKMKVGDSVAAWGSRATINQAAVRYFGQGNYTIRTTENGLRLWRIK